MKKAAVYSIRPIGILLVGKSVSDPSILLVPSAFASRYIVLDLPERRRFCIASAQSLKKSPGILATVKFLSTTAENNWDSTFNCSTGSRAVKVLSHALMTPEIPTTFCCSNTGGGGGLLVEVLLTMARGEEFRGERGRSGTC